ncbi:MAG: hypothetical protein CMF62_00900 [Magnetococcales bacterium]|nr:hypothetical protein [Magnetococcales bacterium]
MDKYPSTDNSFQSLPHNHKGTNHRKDEPLVDLNIKVGQPPKPKPKNKPPFDVNSYLPVMTTNPMVPAQFQTQNQPIIFKNYNIQANGPMLDHAVVNRIYEDVLPEREFNATMSTIGDRSTIYRFIRSVLVKESDGENMSLDPKNKNSLLSYIKFLDLNPYSDNTFSMNPYKDLPRDFLIHRSCYPIRFDSRNSSVECARDSIGMNIRIYSLTNGAYEIGKHKDKPTNTFDSWREIHYYEYIREQIIKKKISPNFVMMHSYYICENCNINFDKLSQLRNDKERREKESRFIKEDETDSKKLIPIRVASTIPYTDHMKSKIGPPPIPLPSIYTASGGSATKAIKLNPNADSGHALLALTESPTYSIYGWGSKLYEMNGNIRNMLSSGFHDEHIWYNVLFQMISALYVLQIHRIVFYQFRVQDFIYIKDLKKTSNATNYWKYIIDGIEYYVPNVGYLVMVDSNFKDIKKSDYTMKKNNKQRYKIATNFLGKKYDDKQLITLSFSAFKQAISPNTWGKTFTSNGGSRLPDEIISLMEKMYNEASSPDAPQDIGYYISKYMIRYTNNRIGTLLTESEIEYIRESETKKFKKGEIVTHLVAHETYKFVLVMGTLSNSQILIATRENPDDDDMITKSVPKDTLSKFASKVIQKYKPEESNLNEDELNEIYRINRK